MKLFFNVLFALFFCHLVVGQNPMEEFDKKVDSQNVQRMPRTKSSDGFTSDEVQQEVLNAQKAQYQFEKARFDYYRESLDNTKRVFGWQYVSSIILFFVIILIVLTGIVFAAIQFKIAMKKATQPAVPGAEATPMAASELELSLKGVKVNSSVLGIVILVISLAFFYLYLIYVYPVTEVNPVKGPEVEEKTAE
jgi:hypothetical protein